MSEFLSMGGYAWYVWGSYGVTFFLLLMEVIFLRMRSKRNEAQA